MSMTSIQGVVARSVGLDTFADITSAPLVMPGGVDRNGLLFGAALNDSEVGAIYDRMTSRDAADQALRAALDEDRSALAPDNALCRLYDYVLDRA